MRSLLLLMNALSDNLTVRSRRVLLLACVAGLALFARSTAAAYQGGDWADITAGFGLLLLFAAGAALACSAQVRQD